MIISHVAIENYKLHHVMFPVTWTWPPWSWPLSSSRSSSCRHFRWSSSQGWRLGIRMNLWKSSKSVLTTPPFFFAKLTPIYEIFLDSLRIYHFRLFHLDAIAALLKRAGGWECAGKPTPSSSSPWSLTTWTPLPPSSRASQHQPPSAFPRSSLAMFECMSLVADQKNLRNKVQQ